MTKATLTLSLAWIALAGTLGVAVADTQGRADFRPIGVKPASAPQTSRKAPPRSAFGTVSLPPAKLGEADRNGDGRISFEELLLLDLATAF